MSAPVKKVPIHLQSAQNRLLIKNGKVVNEDGVAELDVYVEDGIVKRLGRNLIIPGGTRVIEARGLLVLPGGIDPHTHMDFEFMGTRTADDFYHGTKAAVAGGTTTIIDFAFPGEGETLVDTYHSYRAKADPKVCCDYGLHVCITRWDDDSANQMATLCSRLGVNSFKMFMAYDFMLDDSRLYLAFEACKRVGAIAMVHAENGAVVKNNTRRLLEKGVTGPEGHELSRPEEVEAEAVNRACVIAHQVDCPLYVVHVMSKSAGLAVANARNRGCRVFGETLAAALGTDGTRGQSKDFHHSAGHVLSPPLRPDPTTPHFLMTLLAQNNLQTTGSDNCTFTKSQKERGLNDFSKIPNGVNGVEDRMTIIWEKGVQAGLIDPCKFVSITSTTTAKIFNLYPKKGCIAVGSDADIVVWNPAKVRTISAKTHHHAIDFNIFEGMECHGVPEYVIVNGRVCLDDGQLRVAEGYGNFLETNPFPPFVYDPENAHYLKPSDDATDDTICEQFAKFEIDQSAPAPTLPDSLVSTPSCKGPRPEGQRNLQDSTFSISEDTDIERRACIKVKNPPGGKSSGFW